MPEKLRCDGLKVSEGDLLWDENEDEIYQIINGRLVVLKADCEQSEKIRQECLDKLRLL